MTLDPDNVRVGVTGGVYLADLGTPVPTSANGARNNGFADLGYVGEDGIEQAIDTDITTIKAWQNGDVVRKVQTSHDVTFHFTLLETKASVLEAYYGNYTNGSVQITSDVLPHQAWIFDIIDGDDMVRLVVPDGQITERGNVVYKNDEAVGYEVTVTAFPDDNGVKAYKYLIDAS